MTGKPSLLALLLVAGCSARYCGACVGWSTTIEPNELDPLEVEVTERWTRGMSPSPASDRYEGVAVFLTLPAPPEGVCRSLSEVKVDLDGRALRKTRAGGGAIHFPAAGQRPEQCEPFAAELDSTELLGGPVTGPDVLRLGSTAIEFFAGRPRAVRDDGGVRLTIDGFKGTIEPTRFQLWSDDAGIDLEVVKTEPPELLLAPSHGSIDAAPQVLVGDLRLHPLASCRPTRTRCAVTVGYPVRLEVLP